MEPGRTPATGFGGVTLKPVARVTMAVLVPLLMPFLKFLSTPQRAGRVLSRILTDPRTGTGVYFDEGGRPMLGSPLVREPAFQDRVLAETRALLAGETVAP